MSIELKENPKTVLLGRSKKVVIDFLAKKSDVISISLLNEGCESLPLDSSKILQLINYLENPCGLTMVELSDGRCGKVHVWKMIEIRDDQSNFVGYVGVCRDDEGVKFSVQNDNDQTTVSSVRLTDVDVRVLIGLLYFCISNKFLSLETIGDILEDKCLCTDGIEINGVCW